MSESVHYNHEGSVAETRALNDSPFRFDRSITRDPENIITIFTVNTRAQYSASGKVKFEGRDPKERYRKVASINDPKYYFDTLALEGSRDKKNVTSDDGRWVAMDWLNPQNVFSLDQNFVVEGGVQDGTNLLERGLFFIVRPFNKVTGNATDVPEEHEVAAAEKRLRERYTALVRIYQTTASATAAKLPNILSEEMIDALNFARLKTPYNTTLAEMKECDTCGESIPVAAKFHKSESLGVICINPSVEGWKAAVAAGIKQRDDVPEEFRWAGRSPNPR